ncbi:hypothetical protein RHSIM_Rhsim12G0092000 [Rhododendron simsii]|uniref:Uncharacterized protein n=1 Tax=Rhododendron simsii TaxID=118357 RepID=A0A834G1Y6_RHOSS|nr:hypothetical protein RHSIM_Rhsim12G0092000 [Rhododendron simsii]
MGLEDASERWCGGEQAVKGIALDYFQDIFTTEEVSNIDSMLNCVDHRVSERMNRFVTRPISYNEVKVAVFQMPADRAPGPDGMGASFLQEYWDIVGPSLVDVVRSYCHLGHLLHGTNHSHIVLIPNVQCPMNMGQLRPISLCNSVYKVLFKSHLESSTSPSDADLPTDAPFSSSNPAPTRTTDNDDDSFFEETPTRQQQQPPLLHYRRHRRLHHTLKPPPPPSAVPPLNSV